jgi:hypothetical protein
LKIISGREIEKEEKTEGEEALGHFEAFPLAYYLNC